LYTWSPKNYCIAVLAKEQKLSTLPIVPVGGCQVFHP